MLPESLWHWALLLVWVWAQLFPLPLQLPPSSPSSRRSLLSSRPQRSSDTRQWVSSEEEAPLEPQVQPLLDANHRLREYLRARSEYFQDRERAREEGHHLLHIDGADQSDFVPPWVQPPPERNSPE